MFASDCRRVIKNSDKLEMFDDIRIHECFPKSAFAVPVLLYSQLGNTKTQWFFQYRLQSTCRVVMMGPKLNVSRDARRFSPRPLELKEGRYSRTSRSLVARSRSRSIRILARLLPRSYRSLSITLLPVITAILLYLRSTLKLRLLTYNRCFLDGEKLTVRVGVSFGWATFGPAR